MGLSKDLIQQFVEVTNDLQNQNEESFVLGTVHNEGGNYYVKIDGSDSYTPVYSTTKMNEGDRVTVMIKNHTATVTGNITSPSLDGTAVDGKIGAFSDIVTESITAVNGTIDNLVSENVTIKNKLTANEAEIETLKAYDVTVEGKLTAMEADIERIEAGEIDVETLKATFATIENLNATNANVNNLQANFGSFQDLTTEQLTAINAEIDNLSAVELTALNAAVENLKANKANISDLNAANAEITNLKSTKADVEVLEAEIAGIDLLLADKANVIDLNATNANVANLQANKANVSDLNAVVADIKKLDADKADITDLTADNISFTTASGGTLNVQTLLSQFTSGQNAQYLNITGSNATIANAVIKDAMIDSVSVNKLTSGTINTNEINIASDDNSMKIEDGTIQFADEDGNVRLQLGEDASGDFSFILKGEDGTTTLIDGSGIKEGAIADKLIKTGMINDKAITSDKINYESFVTGLNADGTANLIKASKVELDGTGQSLTVAFQEVESSIDGIETDISGLDSRISTNTTSITAANGRIDTLVSQNEVIEQDIEDLNGSLTTISNNYSTLNQTVDGISATVASHTTQITETNNKIDNIQIGGRNLLLSSADPSIMRGYYVLNTVTKIDDVYCGNAIYTTNAAWTAFRFYFNKHLIDRGLVKVGDVMTYSILAKTDNSTSMSVPLYYRTADSYTAKSFDSELVTITTNWTRISKTFTLTEAMLNSETYITYVGFEQRGACESGKYIYWSSPKVEFGNKATDWTPAPEDIDTSITEVQTQVTTNSSSIDILEGQIALKVEQSDITNAVTTAVNNIQIGGTNLFSQSQITAISDPDVRGISLLENGIRLNMCWANNLYTGDIAKEKFEAGQQYIARGKVKILKNTSSNGYPLYDRHYGIVFYAPTSSISPITSIFRINDAVDRTVDEEFWYEQQFTAPSDMDNVTGILCYSGRWADSSNNAEHGLWEITDFKIEKGNKATDWSPAPEDVEAAIETIETKTSTNAAAITLLQDEISLKVEASDVATAKTEIQNDYNEKIENVQTQVTSNKSSIDVLNDQISLKVEASDITAAKTELQNDYNQKITNVQTQATNNKSSIDILNNQIALKVEQSHINTAKTELQNDYNQKITNVQTQATNNKSSIDLLNNQISLKVEQSQVDSTVNNAVNNIQIGGRNLVLNTRDTKIGNINAVPDSNSRAEYAYYNIGTVLDQYPVDTQLTLSFDVNCVKDAFLQIYNTNMIGPNTLAADGVNIKKGMQRVFITYKLQKRTNAPQTNSYIEFYTYYGTNAFYEISKLKIELGNKPTEWTPAPEDVDNAIQTVDTKATTNKSSIDVLQGQIALKVEQSQVNTTVNNAVNNIQVGGRNLVIDSKTFTASNGNNSEGTIEPDGSLKIVTHDSSNYHSGFFSSSFSRDHIENSFEEGDNFTISFWIKSPDTIYPPRYYMKPGMGYYDLTGTVNPDTYSQVYYTGVWKKADTINPHLGFHSSDQKNKTYYISAWKIEKGSKPTDWSAAPEDIENAITTVDQRCASIELDVDSITSTVSNNSGNISTLTQTVNGINSTVSSNTGKISTLTNTVNGLNSTVSNHTGSISTLTNTVNGLNTTVSNNAGNISSLEQTANQIVADFGQVGANLILNGRPVGNSKYWEPTSGGGSTITALFSPDTYNSANWWGEYFRSGFRFRGNLVSGGWAGIRNDSIASFRFSRNKTFSISMIIYNYKGSQDLNVQISDPNSANYVCNKIITIASGYQHVSFTFTPSSSGNTPSLMLMQNSPGEFDYYIPWIVVREGNPTRTWIDSGEEINKGSTIINRDGVTIKNGAIRVEDASGNVMLDGDSDGKLYLRKELNVGTVGQISQSGVTVTDGNLTVVDAIDKSTYESKINSGELVLTYNALTAGGTPPLESKIGIKEGYNGLYIGCEDYGAYGSIKLDGKVEFTRPLEGQIKLNGLFTPLAGTCIHSAYGSSGSTGYVKIARIKILGSYCNDSVKFSIGQRGKSTITDFYFQFGNTESTDPALAAFTKTTGSANAYMVKNTTSTWDIYVQKTEGYDEIAVTDLQIPYRFHNAVVWTWTNEHVTSLPSGYTAATLAAVNIEKFYIKDNTSETLQQSGYNKMSFGVKHTDGDHGIALTTESNSHTLRPWGTDKNVMNLGTSGVPYKDVWLTGFSRANTGYTKLPNEMILQWGQATCNNGSNVTVTFPLKFPTAVYSVWGTGNYSGSRGWTMHFASMGLTGVTLYKTHYAGGTNSDTIFWVALGR